MAVLAKSMPNALCNCNSVLIAGPRCIAAEKAAVPEAFWAAQGRLGISASRRMLPCYRSSKRQWEGGLWGMCCHWSATRMQGGWKFAG